MKNLFLITEFKRIFKVKFFENNYLTKSRTLRALSFLKYFEIQSISAKKKLMLLKNIPPQYFGLPN
jgi:hypothetical protein